MNKKELAEGLAAVPLFARCTKRDLRSIARHVETMTVADGTEVVSQGDDGETFFFVLSGELVVTHDGIETNTLGAYDHFGELALLDPAPRSATVVAQGEVKLAALSVRMFRVLLRDMPQMSAGMLGSLASQLRDAWTAPPASRID
jgi:CRP/FNR family cyclic AMP-dependent transcriptional regulator